jgi:hypothetical protein
VFRFTDWDYVLLKRPTLFLEVQKNIKKGTEQGHNLFKNGYKKWEESGKIYTEKAVDTVFTVGILGAGFTGIYNWYHYYYNPDPKYMEAFIEQGRVSGSMVTVMVVIPRYEKLLFKRKFYEK